MSHQGQLVSVDAVYSLLQNIMLTFFFSLSSFLTSAWALCHETDGGGGGGGRLKAYKLLL